jgi:outer membrane protein
MKYSLIFFITAQSLFCADLASLLPLAKENLRVESIQLETQKTQKQLEEAKTAYFPTVNATALYRRKDNATSFEPKTVRGVEIGAGLTLFDGLKRESIITSLHSTLNSAHHNVAQEEQNILLETVQAYYEYFDARSHLDAITDKKVELVAQVERFSVLVNNDLATKDTLKALIASKLEAEYDEQNQKLILEKCRMHLELLTNSSVDTLEYQELKVPLNARIERHDLQADRSAIDALKDSEGLYTYLPTLSLQGTHRSINHSDYDTMGGVNLQPFNQNEITASLSMTLFDMGRIYKEKERAHLTTLQAKKLLQYKEKSIQNEAYIADFSLTTAMSAFSAAQSELEARTEAFEYVKKRFDAGLVNTTIYLTELSNLSQSRAKVQNAHNALQIAKANLAYTYGTDLMTLIEGK